MEKLACMIVYYAVLSVCTSGEDARINFKLATRMKETCINLKPWIDEIAKMR